MHRGASQAVVLAGLLGACLAAPPARAQTPAATPTSSVGPPRAAPAPTYDPSSGQCVPPPRVSLSRLWRVSPSGGAAGPSPGQSVSLGLQETRRTDEAQQDVTVRVTAPDGTTATAIVPVQANDWADVLYPAQFRGAPALMLGTYTVVWETRGGFVTCGGFVVR